MVFVSPILADSGPVGGTASFRRLVFSILEPRADAGSAAAAARAPAASPRVHRRRPRAWRRSRKLSSSCRTLRADDVPNSRNRCFFDFSELSFQVCPFHFISYHAHEMAAPFHIMYFMAFHETMKRFMKRSWRRDFYKNPELS